MLLSYRKPIFWRDFHSRHWKSEIPTVIRQPFVHCPFSEEMVLNAMKNLHRRFERGDEKFRFLLSPETSLAGTKRVFKSVFKSPVASMDEFGRNCCRVLSNKQFGLMVNNVQSLDARIWDGAAAFLQDAHPWIDFPMGRAIIDLFFGNYSQSFLGLHKDMQEILGFVVKGEKTILAWPFDYFLSLRREITPADRYFQRPLKIDYRPYRKDAIVLKARAGDIIYWSSDYWHVADGGRPDEFSVFLSLGLFRAASSSPENTEVLNRFRKRLLSRPGQAPKQAVSLYSQEVPASDPFLLSAQRLRWATSYSFPFGTPSGLPPKGGGSPLPRSQRLFCSGRYFERKKRSSYPRADIGSP